MPSQESAGVSRPSRGTVLAKRTVTFWLIQEIVRGCNQHTRTPVRVTAIGAAPQTHTKAKDGFQRTQCPVETEIKAHVSWCLKQNLIDNPSPWDFSVWMHLALVV